VGASDIVFGDRDSQFSVVCPDGWVGRYKLPTFQVIKEGYIEKDIEYKSADYAFDPLQDDNPLLIAGTDGYKSILKVIDSRDTVLKCYSSEEGKYT
jgi:hypothetical protein